MSLVALMAATAWATARELGAPHDLRRADYGGADSCTRCHPDHAESFRRTFHRTMTQVASEASVLGDFADAQLEYFGVSAQLERDDAGNFVMRYSSPHIPARRWVIAKTVGSRRYQQYVAQVGDELLRLPLAWHIEEQRWFHMNGAFLTPDPAPDQPLEAADYERHLTRWNDNCVFCHNVAPNPGRSLDAAGSPHFATSVAEHGIACEACHGPGGEHAWLNHNPLRRYWLHATGQADPSIVDPGRLAPDRSLDLCGRCHGQRITDDVDTFLASGDPFLPGESLAEYSAPLWHDTPLHGDTGAFAARFWADGTPRLTAYEYQGVLLSPCAQRGQLTCLSCHAMHGGDPRGQLRPDRTETTLCTQCHADLGSEAAGAHHARHAQDEQTPTCLDCHMPKLVYGVIDIHRSHRISVPEPARAARAERPDACTLCHVDRTRRWAARERARLWASPTPPLPAATDWPETETTLFAGDPIARAVAAHALGESPLWARRREHVRALLLDVMADDRYPAVRHVAQRALDLPARFEPEWPPAARERAVSRIFREQGLPRPQAAAIDGLRSRARALDISIGE